MATQITCSLCDADLQKHCPHCAWWRCPNRECPADIYDVRRKTIRRTDGTVEPYS